MIATIMIGLLLSTVLTFIVIYSFVLDIIDNGEG